jgi:hypothetical protein
LGKEIEFYKIKLGGARKSIENRLLAKAFEKILPARRMELPSNNWQSTGAFQASLTSGGFKLAGSQKGLPSVGSRSRNRTSRRARPFVRCRHSGQSCS